jgi:hypothetical protein
MPYESYVGKWNDKTVGQRQAIIGMNQDRTIRLAKTFGLTHQYYLERAPHGLARVRQGAAYPEESEYRRYSSLAEAYVDFSGDVNINYFGKRVTQIEGLVSFEEALANVLNRMLIEDFAPTDYRWKDIVTSITAPRDFRQNVRTRLTYVPDIGDLAEDQPIPEIQPMPQPVDPESITYTINQKACTFSFTRRVLINDDVGVIQRGCKQLGRSAWRTLAKRVWNLLVSNATYGGDGSAMFCAGHNNLGSAGLNGAALTAARAAIFAQTEPNGPDRLGLGGGPLLLAVPIQLEEMARTLNTAQFTDTDGQPNRWLGRFGPNCERIFANPIFTNQLNWFLFDVSGDVEIIEVGFLQGKQEPYFDVADNPVVGEMFSQDRVVYKMRHEYECAIRDYRGAYCSTPSIEGGV